MNKYNYYIKPDEILLADNITFIITDDCNLRCRYCYEKNKQPKTMDKKTAIDAIHYFFEKYNNKYDTAYFDFIGGEPLILPDICKTIIDEAKILMKKYPNRWKNITFNASTNGTCFDDEKVRDLIESNRGLFYTSLSLDGCKEIHDYNRNNSFDKIMKWFPYWRKNFPYCTTKSTLNHEALPYLFESIKFLFSTNLTICFMNTVYEDVWEKGDADLYYDQLIKSADWILNNKLYKTKYISLFDISTVTKFDFLNNHNWCGCGSSMIAIDYTGNLYPCTRFKTLSKQKPLTIGNIYVNDGELDYKKLLPFYFCHNTINTPNCDDCEAKSSCPNCTAFCYDETGSIFDRVSYMCDMHKARIKANHYYWNKMAEIEGITLQQLIENNVIEEIEEPKNE